MSFVTYHIGFRNEDRDSLIETKKGYKSPTSEQHQQQFLALAA